MNLINVLNLRFRKCLNATYSAFLDIFCRTSNEKHFLGNCQQSFHNSRIISTNCQKYNHQSHISFFTYFPHQTAKTFIFLKSKTIS